ncbi:hypothetical protein [Opitutus sp. ER46]|uniref:hypothetical protein n=1 Tax=Opitutus sp. ER46 TaxID=2161864 RepID=UPI000D31F631|nr:hypothetical protein [Opitutus sp. ER46]PTX98488.1 hypothetical protein DB354_04260 [Opitutus sp. ER46]
MDTCLQTLRTELRACQQRLGTAAERTTDFEQVLSLAHQINNRVAGEYLRAAIAHENSPPSFTSFYRGYFQS